MKRIKLKLKRLKLLYAFYKAWNKISMEDDYSFVKAVQMLCNIVQGNPSLLTTNFELEDKDLILKLKSKEKALAKVNDLFMQHAKS